MMMTMRYFIPVVFAKCQFVLARTYRVRLKISPKAFWQYFHNN